MNVIIFCGGPHVYRRRILPCMGACKGKRRRVVFRMGSPYYGPDYYCAACGDSWCGEGLYSRPFVRGWRAKAIARHKAMWAQCKAGPISYDEDLYPIPDEVAS